MAPGPDRKVPFDLSGRVALVTGSSRGIGRAIALGLAQCGAAVAVHCGSREREARAVAAEIAAVGTRSTSIAAELADPAAYHALVVETVACLGAIDILVLNGSTEIRQDWLDISQAAFDRQIAVNLRSSLLLLQSTVPGMAERGWGRVVSIGSIQEA